MAAQSADLREAGVLVGLKCPGLTIAEEVLQHILEVSRAVARLVVSNLNKAKDYARVDGEWDRRDGYSPYRLADGAGSRTAEDPRITAPVKSMGRRPADAGDGRQAMWLSLKKVPNRITVAAIAKQTRFNRSTVLRYLKALTEAGHLEYLEPPPGRPGAWKLISDMGHHAPRVRADGSKVTLGEVVGQLWLAMCGLNDFDFRDLIQNASIEIPESTAKDYCKRLLAAGYLRVRTKADPARGRIARYRLIRPSGPKAPRMQRVRQVYDPNTGAIYPAEAGL